MESNLFIHSSESLNDKQGFSFVRIIEIEEKSKHPVNINVNEKRCKNYSYEYLFYLFGDFKGNLNKWVFEF